MIKKLTSIQNKVKILLLAIACSIFSLNAFAGIIPSDTNVCVGSPITFQSTTTGTYSWTFPSGNPVTTSTSANPTIFWTTPGSYTVTLKVNNVTTGTATINVTFCAGFTADSTSVCANNCTDNYPKMSTACVTFTDISSGAPTSWQWIFPGVPPYPFITTVQNPRVCYCQPGSWDVTLNTNGPNGPHDTTYHNFIQAGNCPIANFSYTDLHHHDTICVGKCLDFYDQSIDLPTGWKWSFSAGATFSPVSDSLIQNPTNVCYNAPGTFQVYLIDSNTYGFDTSQVQTIVVTPCAQPSANFTIPHDTICVGECVTLTDNSTQGNGAILERDWSMPGGSPVIVDTNQVPACLQYGYPGRYQITLRDSNAFGADTVIHYVQVNPLPNITLFSTPESIIGDTITVLNGTCVNITPGGDNVQGEYFWSKILSPGVSAPDTITLNCHDTTGADIANCTYITACPTQTTCYYIITDWTNGCSNKDSICIKVVQSFDIFVPSAFSPNGDGYNDILYVRGEGIKTMDFAVYNRFGQKVFESTRQDEGWDGYYNGEFANSGVFDWYVKATLFNGKAIVQKGTTTLIR